jgi:hypothetical protein
MQVVDEAGGIPQSSPPHQAGEDRGTVLERGTRSDGGTEPPAEDAGSHDEAARRVQADEGRGQETDQPAPQQH